MLLKLKLPPKKSLTYFSKAIIEIKYFGKQNYFKFKYVQRACKIKASR
jgi:hypothetical protein